MQWVFLGCPGVGKGTYASRLALGLRVPHIAMGDLVRQELKRDSPLSKELKDLVSRGKLLPDELVLGLLTKRLEEASANQDVGFILDGFPRTASQAKTLDSIASITLVVNLRLREDVLVAKCLGRRICSQCHGNFNVANVDVPETETLPRIFMPAILPPPRCLKKMTMRSDDTEEVIRERVRIYSQESRPVEDYYRAQGKLLDFEILGGIPETWPRLLSALNLQGKIANTSLVSAEKQKIAA
ncbi:hypothetical protein SELMODRAFT_407838 [Selaginella moellendorffii]|uniref:adenylate kinase n=1 Tax=Selaginella moellendorffii TaxID=88036 RepID=D8R4X7_SELML|nr:hypothetical protein SELMODRAFT_407838 [Selaginella moellendorffii]